ncbi:hypothetical protein E4U54_003238 [Claviceps lovelessii]|nr:hypothetical protein E4U54_003238 [Claviceps lovelessii]
MNSINIITSRVSPSPSPNASRTNSLGNLSVGLLSDDKSSDSADGRHEHHSESFSGFDDDDDHVEEKYHEKSSGQAVGDNTPLLDGSKDSNKRASSWHSIPRRFMSNLISSVRWFLATIASPAVQLMACFYDEQGLFAPVTQLKKLFGGRKGRGLDPPRSHGNRSTTPSVASSQPPGYRRIAHRPGSSSGSSTSGQSSESEGELSTGSASRHARSKPLKPAEELSSARRSIRIKLHNDDALRQRKQHRRAQSTESQLKASNEDLSAQLKSPTSPVAALTKYPKTPAPPRPLIPRRQPSYLKLDASVKHQKTLILDLDETLIHSMSKGGGRNSGHMVEVRLNTASLGMGTAAGGAAQHPILYWVNKRPYCDEFLRRICKWFNLVIFTASVQEYADPVIDWLEAERKYFSARYYRQHCTYRQGAYIKDLSSVEPDLSKVMILDNSPLSYLFHEGKWREIDS